MQTNEQKKILAKLLAYADRNHQSLAGTAKLLGITQNTISNWKKGYPISPRNQQRILALVGASGVTEKVTSVLESSGNPVLSALLSVVVGLPERDIAKLYAFALELRDLPTQYGYVSASVAKAAEEPAPFNKD